MPDDVSLLGQNLVDFREEERRARNGTDWKPAKRVRNPDALRDYLVEHPYCEVEYCSALAAHAHHIRFRSQSGDDVPANLIALCNRHHMPIHYRACDGMREVSNAVRGRRDALVYLLDKLGSAEAVAVFLDRVYPL